MMVEGGAPQDVARKDDARLEFGYGLVLARQPSARRKQVLMKVLGDLRSKYRADPKAASDFIHQGASEVRPGLAPDELAAWTGVASGRLRKRWPLST